MWSSIGSLFGFRPYSNYSTTTRPDPHFVNHLKKTQKQHSIHGVVCGDGPINVVEVQLNGQTFHATISTGTTISFCSQEVVRVLNLREFKVDGLEIDGFVGSMKFSGYCKATLGLDDLFLDTELLVSAYEGMPVDLMIGVDVLRKLERKYGYSFSFGGNYYSFGPVDLPILTKYVPNIKK